jgi:DNA polymerase-3 subunit delta'
MALAKEQAFERLRNARKSGRLAHACLLSGPPASGKKWLAGELAALVLGTTASEVSRHSDFHQVAPESKSRRILIDQMRDLERALQMKPLRGSHKVAVIHDADRLQPEAANAFLKTLEEPPAGCHIVLTTTLRDAVLQTILSRCITIPLLAPGDASRDELSDQIAAEFGKSLLHPGGADAGAAFHFTRFFQAALAGVRENIADGLDSELKEQLKRHRESIDKTWKESREGQIKAQTEAVAVRERERLLAAIGEVLAAALRHKLSPSESVPTEIQRIAGANDPRTLLKRLDALERTRRLLASGTQEALALESGFLQMIATP